MYFILRVDTENESDIVEAVPESVVPPVGLDLIFVELTLNRIISATHKASPGAFKPFLELRKFYHFYL